MEQATEKQISFALSLGIDNPETFSKQALKEMINSKLAQKQTANKPAQFEKTQPQASKQQFSQQNSPAVANIVISRTEKPHSYEFGKAGARHKIYYEKIEELKAHIDALKEAGLLLDEAPIFLKEENAEE